MLNKAKQLWLDLPDSVRRVLHTGWQSFLGVFLVGITGVLSTGNWSDGRTALLALISAAVAAALSAVKNAVKAKQ